MRFITITIFAVTSRLVALAIAKPVPNWKAGGPGMTVPLARYSSFTNSNKSIDLDAISSHGISVREKILSGLDNYEVNTGTMHPFAVRRSESGLGLGTRDASVSLTTYKNLLWSGEISIGTPAKTLKVQIDTGSADMWVLETGCDGISGDRDLWDPVASKSAEYQDQSFQLEYGDGSIVKGDRFTDNVTIAGFTADTQTFGSATSYTSQLQDNGYSDGLLGLAFPSVSKFHAYPLFESLVRQNRRFNPTFSLKLSSLGAEMYVGGANSMMYSGDITYTPVTVPGFWQVSMDDVRVNGNIILKNVPAVLDTGSSFIFGDWKQVSELYSRLDGAQVKERRGFGFYYLPCDSFPTLSVTFSGKTFEIPPEVLRIKPPKEGSPNCFSALVAERSPVAFWAIGIPFLQGVYSVFDYTKLRVGFADLA